MKSKIQILEELTEELSNAGDIVIEVRDETGLNLYLYKEKNGTANYTLKILTEYQVKELREKEDIEVNKAIIPLCYGNVNMSFNFR